MSFSFSFFRTLLVDLHNDDDLDLEIICNFLFRLENKQTKQLGFLLLRESFFFAIEKKNGKFRDLKKFIQGNEAMIYGGI